MNTVDHQKIARELFVTLLDTRGDIRLMNEAQERHINNLHPQDAAKVLGIVVGLSMGAIARAKDANPGAAAIIDHARGTIAGELFAAWMGGAR